MDFDSLPQNANYVLQRMIGDEQSRTERGRNLLASVTLRQISKLWDMEEYYSKVKSRQRDRKERRPPLDEESYEILRIPQLIQMEIAVPK